MIGVRRVLVAIGVTAALLAAGGCANSGQRFSDVPLAEKVNFPVGTARVYVYRTSVFGLAVQPDVLLNGRKIGDAVPGGFFWVDVAPGEYELSTETEVKRSLVFSVQSGDVKYVRLAPGWGWVVGRIFPEAVDATEANEAIGDCRYTGEGVK